MAGIHLPDIGKLGIHVASGIIDKKKVAPRNMIENARLKAFSKRIDTEKQERYRVLKKEQRKMKIRQKRIDERLGDISRSRTIPLHDDGRGLRSGRTGVCCLPPISVTKKPIKKLKNLDNFPSQFNTGNSRSFTVFPIQEEFGTTLRVTQPNLERSLLPPLLTSKLQSTPETERNIRNSTDSVSDKALYNSSEMNYEASVEENLFSLDTKISAKNIDNIAELNVEIVSFTRPDSIADPLAESLYAQGFDDGQAARSKPLQQSLEDALQAIKTCRYLRTPSRNASEGSEGLSACTSNEQFEQPSS